MATVSRTFSAAFDDDDEHCAEAQQYHSHHPPPQLHRPGAKHRRTDLDFSVDSLFNYDHVVAPSSSGHSFDLGPLYLSPPVTPPSPKLSLLDLPLMSHEQALIDDVDLIDSLCSTMHPTPCPTAPTSPMLTFLSETSIHVNGNDDNINKANNDIGNSGSDGGMSEFFLEFEASMNDHVVPSAVAYMSSATAIKTEQIDEADSNERCIRAAVAAVTIQTPPETPDLVPAIDKRSSSNSTTAKAARTRRSRASPLTSTVVVSPASTVEATPAASSYSPLTSSPSTPAQEQQVDLALEWDSDHPDSFDPAVVSLLAVFSSGSNGQQGDFLAGVHHLFEAYGESVCTRLDSYGRGIIHYAALHNSKETIQFLMSVVNEKELARLQDRWGNTALHYAVQLRQHQLALYLLELGCSSEATNRYGVTPCHMTCEANDAVMLSNLLLNTQHPEAIVTAQAQDGRSLIHLCALHNACEAAEVLIQFGASAAQKDALGYTPQMLAVLHGNCDILEILVMADKEATNEQDMVYGRTPLHWACAVNCAKAVEILVDKVAAKPERRDKRGRTPLFLASLSGNRDIYDFLVSRKACTAVEDYEGRLMTPF